MKKKIKQLFCKHEWKLYRLVEQPPFIISGEYRVLACPKCGKIKKGSRHLVEYEGGGYK